MAVEKTFVMFKPDCVRKGVLGKVIQRLLDAGLTLKALKMIQLDDAIIDLHYVHHKEDPFFPEFKKFMKSVPVVVSVWEGENAVEKTRSLRGPSASMEAEKGTIRGDFGSSQSENVMHASDSVKVARKEIKRFFSPTEVPG